nr:putative ribonuclease H-like domain-containing protein [Tanacetum cinerariifolium]
MTKRFLFTSSLQGGDGGACKIHGCLIGDLIEILEVLEISFRCYIYQNRGVTVAKALTDLAWIEEEVFVCQPSGFKDPNHPDKVYKVVKPLYGLHQAPRAWYETLAKYLLDNGFHRGKIDQNLFIKRQNGDILLV